VPFFYTEMNNNQMQRELFYNMFGSSYIYTLYEYIYTAFQLLPVEGRPWCWCGPRWKWVWPPRGLEGNFFFGGAVVNNLLIFNQQHTLQTSAVTVLTVRFDSTSWCQLIQRISPRGARSLCVCVCVCFLQLTGCGQRLPPPLSPWITWKRLNLQSEFALRKWRWQICLLHSNQRQFFFTVIF